MPIRSARPGKRVQLHRAISKLGWGSRTQAWAWIQAGQVRIDSKVANDPLIWVDLERQRITLAGQHSEPRPSLTLALNKPRNFITTRSDERDRPTVYDLLPSGLPWIFPAGRLDADSEGLLILTGDSSLAVCLTEPEHQIPKVYQVIIRGRPKPKKLEDLRQGIRLADGITRPAMVKVIGLAARHMILEISLTEGKNRQIRRMCAAIGHRVRRLTRIAIGSYQLGDLESGTCRQLDDVDIQKLTHPVESIS